MLILTTDNYSMLLSLIPFHIFCAFCLFPFILSQQAVAKHLANKDVFNRLRFSNSLVSTYTNGSVAVLSILVVFFDEVTINDKINGVSTLSRLSLLLSMSFFLYDVVILTIPLIRHVVCPEYNLEELEKEIPGIKEATTVGSKSFRILPIKLLLCKEWDDKGVVERCAFLGHHITAMISFLWILENNQLLYLANHRLMAEWSTPLLNLTLLSDHFPELPRIVKDLLKVTFTATFIVCRVLTMPYFWLIVMETGWIEGVRLIPRYLQLIAPALLDILNIYWGQKIYHKLIRAFKRIEKEL
jgi:hypothetical protein